MNQNSKQLPDWFNWEDYEQLSQLDDKSKWAFLFAVRENQPSIDIKEIGYSQNVDGDSIERIPELHWRNGVLSHGMKGHRTHEHLQHRIEWFARDAEFIMEDEFIKRQKNGESISGAVITTAVKKGIHGRYVFPDRDSFEKYHKTRSALDGRTIELAINIGMPKKDILEEVERIIDTAQSGFGGVFLAKKLRRQTVLQWSRGLAAWDLKQKGFSQYLIAKLLAPTWRENDMPARSNEPAQDDDKKQVKTALQSVEQMINGGWKLLCGDPIATLDTDLVKIIYKHRE